MKYKIIKIQRSMFGGFLLDIKATPSIIDRMLNIKPNTFKIEGSNQHWKLYPLSIQFVPTAQLKHELSKFVE